MEKNESSCIPFPVPVPMPGLAKVFFILAALLSLAGFVLWKAPWLFAWFGRLPGDIYHESERGRIFLPIASMIVVSLVLTILVNLGSWLLARMR